MKKNYLLSKDNEKVKILRKLGTKKYRKKTDRFLVENLAIIYDAIKSGNKPISLFVTQDLVENASLKVGFILKSIEGKNVFIISPEVNKYFSNLKTPSGIAAIYENITYKNIDLDQEIIYLNGINDPGNLGTIFRSAVSFGVREIVIDEKCADIYNPKTIQASKDAIFKVNISFDEERKVLGKIKEKMDILVTDVQGGEGVEEAFQRRENFCVILGSESHGVSQDIKSFSKNFINIKSDSLMESLNVAVSSGIILYEIFKNKN